jgi:hypothetical protein
MAARRYESYLLRLWESDEVSQLIWRASLESTDTGERRGFADLDSLFAYLETVCQTLSPDDAQGMTQPFGTPNPPNI